MTLALLVAVAGGCAQAPRAAGKHVRRQQLAGEITDTSPQLARHAFINDTAPPPRKLVLVADTWIARTPRDPRLLPLVVALSFEGGGQPIPIRPDRFELWWEGAPAPVPALDQQELACNDRQVHRDAPADAPCRGTLGPSPVFQDLRTYSFRGGLPFSSPRATRLPVRFHSHPAMAGFVHDRLMMPAGSWFATLAYFPVPEGFTPWERRFELRYVPEDGGPPAVDVAFRVLRDPAVHSGAMRRARKDLQREEKEGRAQARAAREAHPEAP